MREVKSLESYEAFYSGWLVTLGIILAGIRARGKEALLIAMSRKMPRIIEYLKKYSDLGDKLPNMVFTTEHVLPYALATFDADRQEIVIVDDAIYYGSTLSLLTKYVHQLTGVRPWVCPIVICETASELPDARFPEDMASQTLHRDDIPFFTTRNAERIIRLRRPLDMEFPILRYPLGNHTGTTGDSMKEHVRKHFADSDCLVIEHLLQEYSVENYTILPKKGTPHDCWNSDFCKLRIYISEKEVQVVSYAPGIISEAAIVKMTPLFSDHRIQSLWEAVCQADVKRWPAESVGGYSLEDAKNEYELQCQRSRVVWANYLASYLYLLEEKDSLTNLVTECFGTDVAESATISREDMSQLLPPHLVEDVTATLNSIFHNKEPVGSQFNAIHSKTLASIEIIPKEYKDEYIKKNHSGWLRCVNVREALALMFMNQHNLFDNGMQENDASQRLQRLRFGTTYAAMEGNMAFALGVNGLWESIHGWIDKNIDEGTVKPRYERVEQDGSSYWIRMFRAGENEHAFTKVRRLCEFIIGHIQRIDNRSFVMRDDVENLLSIIWSDPCGIIGYTYRWDSLTNIREGLVHSLSYKGRPGKEEWRSFVGFLVNQGFLQQITDTDGVQQVSTLNGMPSMQSDIVATPLSAEQESAMKDYLDIYMYYTRKEYQPNIINNFFPLTSDETKAKEQQLDQWQQRFVEYMDKVTGQGDDMSGQNNIPEDLTTEIYEVADNTFKAPAENRGNENDDVNRLKIFTHLTKADTDGYIHLKDRIFTFLVVRELFSQLFIVPEDEKDKDDIIGCLDFLSNVNDEDRALVMELAEKDTKQHPKNNTLQMKVCSILKAMLTV